MVSILGGNYACVVLTALFFCKITLLFSVYQLRESVIFISPSQKHKTTYGYKTIWTASLMREAVQYIICK